jgi:hypothetical protein
LLKEKQLLSLFGKNYLKRCGTSIIVPPLSLTVTKFREEFGIQPFHEHLILFCLDEVYLFFFHLMNPFFSFFVLKQRKKQRKFKSRAIRSARRDGPRTRTPPTAKYQSCFSTHRWKNLFCFVCPVY